MQHQLEVIFNFLKYTNAEKALQLRHRIALVNIWAPGPGAHVIEVGCGQGETTAVLAATVGASGRVLAVDNGPAEYGRPVTLGKAHAYIKASALGGHIEFLRSTDLLDPHRDFPENAFDLAVFSHSSWGFDHGVGHSLLMLYDAKAPRGQKSKEFKGLGHCLSNTPYRIILYHNKIY